MDRADENLIPADTDWLRDPAAQAVCSAVTEAGFDIYFVGGCVRNALLHAPASDVDLATDARPEEVMALAERAGMRAVPTGIDHGTVTVVQDGTAFEVTTFRRDVETDGRRAVVAFSTDIADDARRRDFTMNALYATPQGVVVDPLGGLPDLWARRVRFIEDPAARIREDYLRILRYFRFCAYYADLDGGFEPDTLASISENLHGLETLSAERVGQEIIKLLGAPDPSQAVAVMRAIGVLHAILPGSDDRFLAPFVHLESICNITPDWSGRLAVLGGDDIAARLRLSKSDARDLALLHQIGWMGPPLAEVAYRHGLRIAEQVLLMRCAMNGELPEKGCLETIQSAARAVFPVSARDLMPAYQGPALGARLAELESKWIASGFALSREALIGTF
ncbi:CCA tRNA nucleotidyltransferase [Sulfitobacter sp. G21635-S1]|uniref:CCA tRNA nucleotidyltransferase n=1 Tax=Sulfitobacter sp. G21635-S1 TaxID=3014043 RepID=UPI0022AEDD5E|nr:CCA tRNA nucleotidyltransferase [Sulfitobacter sp. G21635-S1]MCZ4255786.1 CCA tRNA nucleotidyltransferase [Sulfitobacter sp. G21635-S1]